MKGLKQRLEDCKTNSNSGVLIKKRVYAELQTVIDSIKVEIENLLKDLSNTQEFEHLQIKYGGQLEALKQVLRWLDEQSRV